MMARTPKNHIDPAETRTKKRIMDLGKKGNMAIPCGVKIRGNLTPASGSGWVF
jgi:hypothetical protein